MGTRSLPEAPGRSRSAAAQAAEIAARVPDILADLGLQLRESRETTLVAQAHEELERHGRPVDVPVEIEQVGLDAQGRPRPGGHGGTEPYIGHPPVAAPLQLEERHVDPAPGDQFVGGLQVGRGNPQLRPQPPAVDHPPLQRVGARQQAPRQAHMAARERLADGRTRHAASPELHLVDLAGEEALFLPYFLEQVEAPLPPVSEGEVRPHVDFPENQPFP